MELRRQPNSFVSTRKLQPLASMQQTQIFDLDVSSYPAEVRITSEQQHLIADVSTETLLSVDVSQPADMSAGEYATLAFRVVVLLQLAYEMQLLEMDQLEQQNDRAKTMEKNYHTALEQLEKLQHERSLRMETPAGELREQVNSLSDTVEHLTSHNKDMEETAAIAKQTIQELDEANKKLQTKLQEQDTTIHDHNQEIFLLQKQASDLRYELSRLQAIQSAASAGAGTAVSQHAFILQMDELESAYQKQLEDLESQLDGVKAENLTLCMEVQDIGKEVQKEVQMKTQLQDDLRITEQTAAHLKAEELSLRDELNAQIKLLSELEKRFERQVADSHKEMEALQMQLVQSQKKSGQLFGDTSDNEPNIEQLVEADNTVKVLTAEKIQLLEAYELLESDTGRLIDDAIRAHKDQVDVLNGQLEAKGNEYAVLSEDLADMKIRLCSMESLLATTQQDLKDVVSGDLQLASALKEVRHLRSRLKIVQTEKLQAAAQRDELSDMAEFYFEENSRLRNMYEPGTKVEFYDWQQQRHSKLAELEALNSKLERMVAGLEDDCRRGACSRLSHGNRTNSNDKSPHLFYGVHKEASVPPTPSMADETSQQPTEQALQHFAKLVLAGHNKLAHQHPSSEALVKAARDVSSEDGICDSPNQTSGKNACGTLDASRLHVASKTATAHVFSDLQGQAADSNAEQIDKQRIPQNNHEQLNKAGQIIASLQAALCSKDQELLRLRAALAEESHVETAPLQKVSQVSPDVDINLWHATGTLNISSSAPKDAVQNMASQHEAFGTSHCVQALARAMEEAKLLRRSLEAMTSVCQGYHTQLQLVMDQRNILYRDYAAMSAHKNARCLAQQSRSDKLVTELAAANTQLAVAEMQAYCGTNRAGERDSNAVDTVVLRCKLDRSSRELAKARDAQSYAQRQMEGLSWKLREMHVACIARTRVLHSVNINLESRLMQTHQQLLQAVPAHLYFRLLDRHMSVVRGRHAFLSLTDSNSIAFPSGSHESAANCALQQRYLEMCKIAADRQQQCHKNQLMLSTKMHDVSTQIADELQSCRVELTVAEAKAKIATETADRLANELNSAQVSNADLQQHLASEAKKVRSAQFDTLAARQALHASVPAAQVDYLQQQIEILQEDLKASQEALEQHCVTHDLRDEAENVRNQEMNRILTQLSEVKQERDQAKAMVRRMQSEATRSSADTLKAMAAEKELELNRMSQALSRAKADMAMAQEGFKSSQRECTALQSQVAVLYKSKETRCTYVKAMADALVLAKHNTVALMEQLGVAVADRVPSWEFFLLLTKLASVSSVSTSLEGINKLLTQHIVEDAAGEDLGDSNQGRSDMVHPKSLSLFSFGDTAKADRDLKMKNRLGKSENVLLANEAALFSQCRSDLLARSEQLEKFAALMGQEHAELRTTETALAKHIKAQLELLHDSALPLCSKPDEPCGHQQLVANVQVAPTVFEVAHPTTVQTFRTSSVNYQDTSLALNYIDSIKGLRDELAEREKECAEAAQEKNQLQAQYNLVSIAHNELLQRMNVLVQPCESEAHRDVPGDRQLLAAAQTVMRGQEDALKSQEQKLAALNCELSSIQHMHTTREQELLSRIDALEEQLAKQLICLNDVTNQQIPEGSSSVDEMVSTITELKAELESCHENMGKRQQLWTAERQCLMQTTAPCPHVIGSGATQPPTFAGSGAERRLRETLSKKDKLVMALRDAIKQLESKLIESEKKNADSVIDTSLGRQVETLSNLVASIKNEKSSLERDLHDERINSSRLKTKLADAMQEITDLKNTLMNANGQTQCVLEELAKAQECIGTLQQDSAITSSLDASLSNSKAQIVISTLTNRLHVLEAQNAKLKSAATQDKNINAMQQTASYVTHSVTSSVLGSSQPLVMDLELTAHPPAIEGLHIHSPDAARVQMKHALPADDTGAQTLNSTAICSQKSKNAPGLNARTSPHALSRQLATLRKRLMKKEEESMAVTQQGRLKDQRIMRAEKKIQVLEASLSKRSAEVKFLKHTSPKSPHPSVRSEQIHDIISKIKRAGGSWNDEGNDIQVSWNQYCHWVESMLHEAVASKSSGSSEACENIDSSGIDGQNELITTIQKHQRDFQHQQKEMQNMIPSSKYMQEVSAHKATKKELAHARCSSGNAETMQAEIRKRDQQLTRWRTENATLKKKLVSTEAKLGDQRHTKEPASFEPITNSIPLEQVMLQRRCAEVCAENEALKSELDAFDPEFFDEIEDLKFDRQQLAQKVERYGERIVSLTTQLGMQADLS